MDHEMSSFRAFQRPRDSAYDAVVAHLAKRLVMGIDAMRRNAIVIVTVMRTALTDWMTDESSRPVLNPHPLTLPSSLPTKPSLYTPAHPQISSPFLSATAIDIGNESHVESHCRILRRCTLDAISYFLCCL